MALMRLTDRFPALQQMMARMQPPAAAPEPPPSRNEATPPLAVQPAPLRTDPNKGGAMPAQYKRIFQNDSPILLQQRSKAGVGFRTNWGIIKETIAKSGHVRGLIAQRKASCCRREMWWEDRDTSPEAQMLAQFMRECDYILDMESARFGGVMGDMIQALDANIWPLSVHKITWDFREIAPMVEGRERRRGQKRIVPVDIAQEDHDRIGFDYDGRLCIYAHFASEAEAAAQGFTKVPQEQHWWYPSPWSYIVLSPYSYADHPYGGGYSPLEVVTIIQWLWRMVRVFHANFIERNTSPVATVERDVQAMGASDTDIAEIDDFLENIQQETGMKFPAGFHFNWHELMSQASPQAIENFQRIAQYETASALIGQSSTSMTERSGSQSSAEVQERVADSIVAVDSLMLQSFRNQVMWRVMALNFPHLQHKWPSFRVQIDNAQDMEKIMGVWEKFIANGGKVTERQAMRKLGIDEARPGEPTLKPLPAPYAGGAQGPPSQRKENKTPARSRQRESNRPAQSQAQPRNQRS